MNPVFADKLASHTEFDNNGRTYVAAGDTEAPGALPHVPNAPGALAALRPPKPAPQSAAPAAAKPASEPTALASVRLPQAAPLPKEGDVPAEQPTTIAGLLGNLFGGNQAAARPVGAGEPKADRSRCAAPMKDREPSAGRGPYRIDGPDAFSSAGEATDRRPARSRGTEAAASGKVGRCCRGTTAGVKATRRSGREARDAGFDQRRNAYRLFGDGGGAEQQQSPRRSPAGGARRHVRPALVGVPLIPAACACFVSTSSAAAPKPAT